MAKMQEGKLLTAVIVGLVIATLFTSVLVPIKETNPGLKTWLRTTFTHHWIGHGVLTLAVFALSTLAAFPLAGNLDQEKSLWLTLLATIAGSLIISGFYVLEYLHLI